MTSRGTAGTGWLRFAILATALGTAIGLSSCGGSSAASGKGATASLVVDPGQVSPSPQHSGSTNPASTPTAPPAKLGQAGSAQGSPAKAGTAPTPSPAPSAPQYAEGTTPAPATAALASSCLTPGGTQTLSVHSRPAYAVTFDSQYSDGTDGRKHGGVGTGHLDSTGNYLVSWVVQPGTPAGNVIVWVSVAGGSESAFRQPTFVVAGSC
ncbi:MAG: hypothetical protein QOK05_2354 [Chloroflexota bacterium]|jgi:hypothetical protein|nr:hypothetical protein [Chloroflexota bacterium]